MPRVTGDRGHRRTMTARGRDAPGDLEPTGPTAAGIPPVQDRPAIGGDSEHVQVLGIPGDDAERGLGPSDRGGQRADPVPDHLTADPAERHAEIAHLAVVFGPETAAMVVVRAL